MQSSAFGSSIEAFYDNSNILSGLQNTNVNFAPNNGGSMSTRLGTQPNTQPNHNNFK